MNKTTNVKVTLGVKFGSGNIYCYIRNKICYMSIECTPSSDVMHGDIVASGLPKPVDNNAYLSLQLANGYSYSALVDSNGTLRIYFPAYGGVSRIDTIISYIVY